MYTPEVLRIRRIGARVRAGLRPGEAVAGCRGASCIVGAAGVPATPVTRGRA